MIATDHKLHRATGLLVRLGPLPICPRHRVAMFPSGSPCRSVDCAWRCTPCEAGR